MPNMFGKGQLKTMLQQLASEVWEEAACAPDQLWKRNRRVVEKAVLESCPKLCPISTFKPVAQPC